jgi:uncharacterized protein
MNEHEKINYVGFPANDLDSTKAFFLKGGGWTFEDFGPDYTAFPGEGLDGGFFRADQASTKETCRALIVLSSKDLKSALVKVQDVGGMIDKPMFSFPGGRRFQFTEPSGNELAVWSDLG